MIGKLRWPRLTEVTMAAAVVILATSEFYFGRHVLGLPSWRVGDVSLPLAGAMPVFLDSFGRPDPNQDPPCERTGDTTVVQALRLMNAPNLHRKVTQDGGRAAVLAASTRSPREIARSLPGSRPSASTRRSAPSSGR